MSQDEQDTTVDVPDVVPPVLDDNDYLFDTLETPAPASLEPEVAPVFPTSHSSGAVDAQGTDASTSIITQVIPDRSLAPEVLTLGPPFGAQSFALGALALAVLLVSVLVLFTKRRSSARGSALLLVGPPDAGKSAILSALVYKRALPTHASLQTNSSFATLLGAPKPLRVIDVPGHPRVRDQFKQYLGDARAIAFVVDANTVSRNGARAAEHLHAVMRALSSIPPSQPVPALLILAHKTDLIKAGSADLATGRVRTVLERELEKRRAAAASGISVEGLGADGGVGAHGTLPDAEEEGAGAGLECAAGQAFTFDAWEGGEVVLLGTCAPAGTAMEDGKAGGLAPLVGWLEENE
ncbi:signal recognition particle receptor beta subunit-domain-containing protein [Schizophyllum amplum]|uniref:Signal recognition particle receptor subunit beta n=1 Tax=Schizophyllum amplum TaxID=97359 RepID=A0A550CCR6_9AGAR|nr:signal recognition particle receptor beta subunit-domain-containing protein [Auriculariopsis ampla]